MFMSSTGLLPTGLPTRSKKGMDTLRYKCVRIFIVHFEPAAHSSLLRQRGYPPTWPTFNRTAVIAQLDRSLVVCNPAVADLSFAPMSVLHPRRSRRWMLTVVTVTLLAAAFLTLIHWHQDSSGQRCEICFARDLPSLHAPFTVVLEAPSCIEWHIPAEEATNFGSEYFQLSLSRAPPRTASL